MAQAFRPILRSDPTYSDDDLIRIYNNNLTPAEQQRVVAWFRGFPAPKAIREVAFHVEQLLFDIDALSDAELVLNEVEHLIKRVEDLLPEGFVETQQAENREAAEAMQQLDAFRRDTNAFLAKAQVARSIRDALFVPVDFVRAYIRRIFGLSGTLVIFFNEIPRDMRRVRAQLRDIERRILILADSLESE